jgi:uncharacterized protein GlcG (DUF336 family)
MSNSRTVQTITLQGALTALAAAQKKAEEIGVPMCMAVCDVGGNLVATIRMDGAPLIPLEVSRDKAWTVAGFNGLPTHLWWGMIGDTPELVHGLVKVPRLMPFGGGLPLMSDGRLIGAIGVSGGSQEQDQECAAAGVAALA